MSKRMFKVFLLLMVSLVFVSCAAQKAQMPQANATEPPFVAHKFDLEKYGQKANTFIVILDASFSMRAPYGDGTEFDQAKTFVSRMTETLPDLDLTAGLRSFGHNPNVSKDKTVLFYGMSDYTKEGLDGALTALKYPGGKTPMAEAIDAAANDLKGTQGQIAVILISDGDRELMERSAAVAAETMKNQYGDKLCIYTVFIGDEDPESKDPAGVLYRKIVGDVLAGKALMNKIVENGQCGVAGDAKDKMSSQGMADFVETVFLKKYTDSDGDGVWDHLDQCPNTPRGVKVDEKGCPIPEPKAAVVPMDSDGDGVINDVDQCPRTPAGAQVDERGCWVIRTINFDFDKYDIKEEFYPRLNKVVEVLNDNLGLTIEIEGHTDNVGSVKYNQMLSEKRALAVKKYLVAKGISADRLRAVGYGMSKPIATNESEAGRAKNRRVEMTPTGL